MPKMHRCLAIVEVQRTIFYQVRLGDFSAAASPTLARLAQTCRTFSDVALDVLWEELGSIAPLIQCLPKDLWEMIYISDDTRHIILHRSISLEDWEILRRYSSRVRSLSVVSSAKLDKILCSNAIHALSQPPHNGPLIPHLKSLEWMTSGEEYTPLLPVLFTPTLVIITLHLYSPELLTQLTSACPSLKNFRVFGMANEVKATFTQALMRLQSLESLFMSHCDTLDEAAILHLSRLPSFIQLSLELQEELPSETLRRGLVPPAFTTLQYLELGVDELSSLTSLLQVMRFRPQSVTFRVEGIPTLEALCLFFSTLADACDPVHLTDIALKARAHKWLPGAEREQVSLTTFQPLLVFPNVESFKFNAMCNIVLDDDEITTLAECWPNISHLSLNGYAGWGMDSQVTHRGLVDFLSRCAELYYLAIEVDFTEIDLPFSDSDIPVSYGIMSPCRVVDFVRTSINHPPTILTFLLDVCPWLMWVSGSRGFWDIEIDAMVRFPGQEKWEEVCQLLNGVCMELYHPGPVDSDEIS